MPTGYAKFSIGGTSFTVPIRDNYKGNILTEEAHDSVWETCTKKNVKGGYLCFANGATLHCPYGPAKFLLGKYSYYIKGEQLGSALSKKMEDILKDISLAPLYLNHKILRYPARWILKNPRKPL